MDSLQLVLMRHGIAADPEAGMADADRPLTDEGRRKVRRVAKGLRAIGVAPDVIGHSGLVRARETAELVAERLRPREPGLLVTDALEPGAAPARVLELLAKLEVGSVLLVGHAPHVDRFVALACGSTRHAVTEMGKAGAACFELEGPSRRAAQLVWLLPPSVLRELGR